MGFGHLGGGRDHPLISPWFESRRGQVGHSKMADFLVTEIFIFDGLRAHVPMNAHGCDSREAPTTPKVHAKRQPFIGQPRGALAQKADLVLSAETTINEGQNPLAHL